MLFTKIFWLITALFAQYAEASQISHYACYLSGSSTACLEPINVASGGTGTTMLTSNGVLIGNGASAITAVTGTTSQVLIGGTGPTFGSVPSAALPTYSPGTTAGIVPATGLPGYTNGTVPSSGNVGYSPSGVAMTMVTSVYNATEAWTTAASESLPAGNWLIFVSGSGYVSTMPSAGQVACDMRIQDTTNSATLQLQKSLNDFGASPGVTGQGLYWGLSMQAYRSLSASATIAVQVGASGNSGTPTNGACTTQAFGTLYTIQMP